MEAYHHGAQEKPPGPSGASRCPSLESQGCDPAGTHADVPVRALRKRGTQQEMAAEGFTGSPEDLKPYVPKPQRRTTWSGCRLRLSSGTIVVLLIRVTALHSVQPGSSLRTRGGAIKPSHTHVSHPSGDPGFSRDFVLVSRVASLLQGPWGCECEEGWPPASYWRCWWASFADCPTYATFLSLGAVVGIVVSTRH